VVFPAVGRSGGDCRSVPTARFVTNLRSASASEGAVFRLADGNDRFGGEGAPIDNGDGRRAIWFP